MCTHNQCLEQKNEIQNASDFIFIFFLLKITVLCMDMFSKCNIKDWCGPTRIGVGLGRTI